MTGDFGGQLRNWRGKRRMSQLQLALVADVSARHIAFLETGRAKPSRHMVLRLGEALEVPRAERNLMLDAAGYRAAYARRPLDSATMAPIRRAISHMIAGHMPYPAFVFDRCWTVMDANASGHAMLSASALLPGTASSTSCCSPDRAQNWWRTGMRLPGIWRPVSDWKALISAAMRCWSGQPRRWLARWERAITA